MFQSQSATLFIPSLSGSISLAALVIPAILTLSCESDSDPGSDAVKLTPSGKITSSLIPEPSGIVKSRTYPGVYWVHNDKGNTARIFGVRLSGELIQPPGQTGFDGIQVKNADNKDWEDITCDDQGYLYIADLGNKESDRRDLVIYKLREPDPFTDSSVKPEAKYPVYYPDQTAFPAPSGNYNCESLFWSDGFLYVLTKHDSDGNTRLYRLDSLKTDRPNGLTLLGTWPAGGKVTGAEASPDGQKLAVLTYNAIRIYQKPEPGKPWLDGSFKSLRLVEMKYEGICFSTGDTLVVSNEEGDQFAVPVSGLKD
ncbi:MAG: hypothetical protein L6Q77_14215 [Bacteroidetes bacterium]|nr:hypothetical protein [Bacteroidota bacterium]